LESLPAELIEAAMVDGASRWQLFWRISWPQLIPVTSTLILIRMIEAFKIIDLPNVLTNGGPGTATESLTLHAFMAWRTLDIGGGGALPTVLDRGHVVQAANPRVCRSGVPAVCRLHAVTARLAVSLCRPPERHPPAV